MLASRRSKSKMPTFEPRSASRQALVGELQGGRLLRPTSLRVVDWNTRTVPFRDAAVVHDGRAALVDGNVAPTLSDEDGVTPTATTRYHLVQRPPWSLGLVPAGQGFGHGGS